MSYIENHLIDGEVIIQKLKSHWVIFMWPGIVLIFGLLIYSKLLICMAILYGLSRFIYYLTSEFGITNKKIIAKFGFIKRASLEIMLNRIEGITINQSVLGRLMGYGTIVVNGIGGSRECIPYIPNPLQFRSVIQAHLDKLEDK